MTDLTLSAEQMRQFDEDGYLILENLLPPEDVERILRIARCDPQLAADAKGNQNYEGEGLDTRLAYRPGLADDVYSALARSRRLVEPLEQLFGDQVRYYYQLQMMKDPQTGGWQYHQDYGYHYEQFFYPAFASVMVALDPATRANGCLKVVRGSNRLGRLEHQSSGSQRIADPQRVAMALREMEEVYCELTPGSVLYFHGNTLHASEPNLSLQPRWSLIYAYVAAANTYVLSDWPENQCPLIEKWDDSEVGRRCSAALGGRSRYEEKRISVENSRVSDAAVLMIVFACCLTHASPGLSQSAETKRRAYVGTNGSRHFWPRPAP